MLRPRQARQLRLGVGSHGSIPWQVLVVLLAFAVLMLLKFCSLGLDRQTPRNTTTKKGKVVRMNVHRRVLSSGLDTAAAVGAGMVAGLPLLA
jgi:hypothetical protein